MSSSSVAGRDRAARRARLDEACLVGDDDCLGAVAKVEASTICLQIPRDRIYAPYGFFMSSWAVA
jgi:hypothetical protein